MPVTVASVRNTPYKPGNLACQPHVVGVLPPPPPGALAAGAALPALPTVATKFRNEHVLYPTDSGRVTLTLTGATAHDARTFLSGNPLDPNGDTIFLHFFAGEMTSIRLPCPAPAGLTLFVTDSLTGCKFFVDEEARRNAAGGYDLIVYHANTTAHSAGPLADCDVQTVAAANLLDQMHADAVADYARFGVVLNPRAECAKPTYFGQGGHAERHKRNQGRQAGPLAAPGAGASFMGECTIVGFPSGNTWEFWYQTYGTVSYTRPNVGTAQALKNLHLNYLIKRSKEGLTHGASYDKFRVVDYARIY
jgi:hypothetical protein